MRVRNLLLGTLALGAMSALDAQTLPTGFQLTNPITGRSLPTGVYFAHDGRVFVTEKNGKIWVYRNLADTAPTQFADLSAKIHTIGDRGLLGFALDPRFPEVPEVYVLYAFNGGLFDDLPPRWTSSNCGGGAGMTSPTPSPTSAGGCVVSGHLSRLHVNGNVADTANETVLIEDWYQFFPSHSIGTLLFGEDGYLYVGSGDGASYNWADWGQGVGNPTYPDERSPMIGGTPEGGALRSQGLEVESSYANQEIWLDGTILRLNAATGEGAPDNPLAATGLSVNAKRVIAYGLRNPFRFTERRGTGEIWVGDVGWNTWEEVNRIPAVPDDGTATLTNFGWPCFEGRVHTSGYNSASLPICTTLYANANTGGRTPWTQPWYTYVHSGSSDVTGLAFYQGTSYPVQYRNSLFIADNSRTILFNIPYADANADGIPDPPADSAATAFFGGANATAVQLVSGPGEDIFFPNINNGRISRLSYCNGCTNVAPSAAIALDAGSIGDGAPRDIAFTAANSVDLNGDALSYDWDLDGDGNFGDASGVTASAFFSAIGAYKISVKVTDGNGGSDIARMIVTVINSPPTVTIEQPAPGQLWVANDSVMLSASSSDPEQGVLPDDALVWHVWREDCMNPDFTGCTESLLGSFTGATTPFMTPDAAFPAYLHIVLDGTDNGNLTDTAMIDLYPATADLTLMTDPPGLYVNFGDAPLPSPANRIVIGNATTAIGTEPTQMIGETTYLFDGWSDGGDADHLVNLPPGEHTLLATFFAPADIAVSVDDGLSGVKRGQTVTWRLTINNVGINGLSGVLITSALSRGLIQVSWTCDATMGSSCTAFGSGAPNDSVVVASRGGVSYTITATVSPAASGTVSVSASAAIPSGYVDQNPDNNHDTDIDAVTTDVIFKNDFE